MVLQTLKCFAYVRAEVAYESDHQMVIFIMCFGIGNVVECFRAIHARWSFHHALVEGILVSTSEMSRIHLRMHRKTHLVFAELFDNNIE